MVGTTRSNLTDTYKDRCNPWPKIAYAYPEDHFVISKPVSTHSPKNNTIYLLVAKNIAHALLY